MGSLNELFGRRRPPTPGPSPQAILAFIQAQTWDGSRRILEAHPELLSEEADGLLGQLIEVQEDDGARRTLEEHRALLRRCREVGLEAAFAEKMLPPEMLEQAAALGLTPEQAFSRSHALSLPRRAWERETQ